jgi:hypothetical protein
MQPTELENAVPTELERCNQRSWKDATNRVGKMHGLSTPSVKPSDLLEKAPVSGKGKLG